jgi:lysozyme family protein
MPQVTNAAMIAANADRWTHAHIRPEWQVAIDETAARLMIPVNRKRFEAVAKADGVPWHVVAIIKEREAGADPAFRKSIAQGDVWSAPSRNVPKDRGPFASWEAAAHDALVDCAPFAGRWRDWSIGGALALLEKYNGVGYALRGLPSPYVWSATDQYVKGKYVRDGVFDSEFVDRQIGCAALLLAMQKRDPSIVFAPSGLSPRATEKPPAAIVNEATKTARRTRAGAATVGVGAGSAEASRTGTQSSTQVPATTIVPPFVTYSVVGIAIAVALLATVLIARKARAIEAIW